MTKAHSRALSFLTLALGVTVAMELVLLRTGTRTLVHIPGLGRFELATGLLAEVGRLVFYTAIVALVCLLGVLAHHYWKTNTPRGRGIAGVVWLFLGVAAAGRLGMVSNSATGWVLAICLVVVTATTWHGTSSTPLGFFVLGSILASWSVLGQGTGGGLSGQTVDVLVLASETMLVLAGVLAPLLVRGGITRGAMYAGSAVLLMVVLGFSLGGSTLSILTLWNLGVPGWLSPMAFGIAFAGIVVGLWSSVVNGERYLAVALVLLIGGGVGTISTYQTALVFAGVLLVGLASPDSRQTPVEVPEISKVLVAS